MTAATLTEPGSVPRVTLPLVTAIEDIWSVIRERHPDVPPVVVTFGSGTLGVRGAERLGHFAVGRWQIGADAHAELFIGGEGLQRGPAELLATLLHEAAHGIASTRQIQDTSRQGRYHNRRFKTLAEEVGLAVTDDPKIGWSPSTVTADTATAYADQIKQLAAALVGFRHPEPTAGRAKNKNSNNGVAATCGCPEPRRIRVRSRQMFTAGPIMCGICRQDFTAPELDEEDQDQE